MNQAKLYSSTAKSSGEVSSAEEVDKVGTFIPEVLIELKPTIGLLFRETVDDFKRLFQTWLDAMGGVHPKTIIIDQDVAIATAILGNFSYHASWNDCLYRTHNEEEFVLK
ncbi:hypothetical protein ACLOJK_034313 [Asimina triloba]